MAGLPQPKKYCSTFSNDDCSLINHLALWAPVLKKSVEMKTKSIKILRRSTSKLRFSILVSGSKNAAISFD